jgi:hypothetical protein
MVPVCREPTDELVVEFSGRNVSKVGSGFDHRRAEN